MSAAEMAPDHPDRSGRIVRPLPICRLQRRGACHALFAPTGSESRKARNQKLVDLTLSLDLESIACLELAGDEPVNTQGLADNVRHGDIQARCQII